MDQVPVRTHEPAETNKAPVECTDDSKDERERLESIHAVMIATAKRQVATPPKYGPSKRRETGHGA